MSLTSLYLAPTDIHEAVEREPVLQVLEELGIAGETFKQDTWLAGSGFARHVIYAGCSPHLVMTPPADGSQQFCHLAVHGPWPSPKLVTGPNTVKPRCPDCRARFNDWRDQLADWQQHPATLTSCDSCGGKHLPCALDWREHAICGRLLIELRNVYPGEATPSDLLLARLSAITGTPWRYAWAAYLRD